MALFSSTSIPSAAASYDIDNSCRFDGLSSVLTWTPSGSADTTTTCTISFWIKHTDVDLGSSAWIYGVDAQDEIYLSSGGKHITYQYQLNNAGWGSQAPAGKHRDPSAWFHVVVVFDTTQVTASNRTKYYINGKLQTTTGTLPNQNDTFSFGKGGVVHRIGSRSGTGWFSGYLAEFHQVIGQALDPTSFGETGDYDEWKPKKYSGSHGTNGFHLDFKNSGSLGNDAAGSNNFAVSGITAYDQMLDSPTNNFATLNPIARVHPGLHRHDLKEGNLYMQGPSNGHHQGGVNGTLFTNNKIYYEFYVKTLSGHDLHWGIAPDDYNPSSLTVNNPAALRPGKTNVGIISHGVSTDIGYVNTWYDGSSTVSTSGYAATTVGQIVSVAFDPATGKYWFARNNSWQASGNPATGANPIATLTNLNHTWTANISAYGPTHQFIINFGQDSNFAGEKTGGVGASDDNDIGSFYYAPPSGFLAICSKNISDPAVTPREHFNTILYDNGAGAKTGVGFQPDMVWVKSRGSAYSHKLTDAVRGVTKALSPNLGDSAAEVTDSTGLTAFGADGFTVGADTNYSDTTGDGMVAWCWKANGAGSANTDGDINTTATSANTAAGFSISRYLGIGGTDKTVGHGLSKAPELVIVREQDHTGVWQVGTKANSIVSSMDFTDAMNLNDSTASTDYLDWWNDTDPTASVVTLGGSEYNNHSSGRSYMMYCWHSIEGYSKIGSYNGNGNAEGPFVYCGFRPAYLWIKRINASGQWRVQDDARDTYNPTQETLMFDATTAAADENPDDFLSNGFKVRTSAGETNNASGTYVFMAFSRTPLKYANAR